MKINERIYLTTQCTHIHITRKRVRQWEGKSEWWVLKENGVCSGLMQWHVSENKDKNDTKTGGNQRLTQILEHDVMNTSGNIGNGGIIDMEIIWIWKIKHNVKTEK